MKKFLITILYILGFPALIGLVVYYNINIIKGGISYGVYPFVGIIIAVVFALIYFLVVGIMAKKGKSEKRKKKCTKYHQTFVAMILCFCMLGGFWIVVDVALPDFLADATSGTVFYEDLADDYATRAEVNKGLLDEYIELNVANGNLPTDEITLEEYKKQGMKNQTVKELLAIHYQSIDQTGYATFGAPYINMATSDRMTIAVLVHLLFDERNYKEVPYYLYNPDTGKVSDKAVVWNVLDMNGNMELTELDFLADQKSYDEFMGSLGTIGQTIKAFKATPEKFKKWVLLLVNGEEGNTPDLEQEAGILPQLTYDLTKSPIFLGVDGTAVVIEPSVSSRGSLDYMRMAWLNSNGLLYAIVALFSLRKLFLIFAVWMIVNNFMIGLLRGMGKELKNKNSEIERSKNELGYDNYNYGDYGYNNDPYGYNSYGSTGYSNAGYGNYSQYDYYQQPSYNYIPQYTSYETPANTNSKKNK